MIRSSLPSPFISTTSIAYPKLSCEKDPQTFSLPILGSTDWSHTDYTLTNHLICPLSHVPDVSASPVAWRPPIFSSEKWKAFLSLLRNRTHPVLRWSTFTSLAAASIINSEPPRLILLIFEPDRRSASSVYRKSSPLFASFEYSGTLSVF